MADFQLSVFPNGQQYADMTLKRGILHALDAEEKQILYDLARRVASIRPFQARLEELCDRFDALYFPEDITQGGADIWAKDRSASTAGMKHVSVNTPPLYVDIPAALQAVEPIENMLATDTTEESRDAASALERVYVAWKHEEDFDLKFHKAAIIKGLYGITAARVYWDPNKERPCIQIIEQPRFLHLGYKTDSYEELEWAAYVTRYEPNALAEQFGVDVTPFQDEQGVTLPLVTVPDENSQPTRAWLQELGDARIEVWDYWYRQPVFRGRTFVRMDTYNVVIAGNLVIRGPVKYPEYEGKLPYLPLYNTFIPGMPMGRPDLYDVEPILREKTELITAGSQMIANGVAGDFWQLVGPDAPLRVPAGLKPKRNEMVAPGPGNRIETITPFIAEFQLEQHLGRLDREAAAMTGLNDLLLGLAPAAVLNSSKAINALIANFESRLSIRRRILYRWRRMVWELAHKVWRKRAKGDAKVALGYDGFLEIVDPSLSPREEGETAVRAGNLVAAKLISQRTGMDMVGINDPETEQMMIREESTDATLWPERVQIMAQLLAALQSLGLQAPPGAQAQAQGQLTSGQADLRSALGAGTPVNDQGTTGEPSMQGQTPPIPGLPPEAGGPQLPFAQAPEQSPALLQSMIQGGEVKGRILTQTKLGRR